MIDARAYGPGDMVAVKRGNARRVGHAVRSVMKKYRLNGSSYYAIESECGHHYPDNELVSGVGFKPCSVCAARIERRRMKEEAGLA